MQRRRFLIGAAAAPLALTALPAVAQDGPARPIGLILVGASWCPFCKAAAQTLNASAGPAGLSVLIASQDGKPIEPYADFVDARGHPIARDILAIPTLVFVHIPSQEIIAQIEGFRNPRAYLARIRGTLVAAEAAGYA